MKIASKNIQLSKRKDGETNEIFNILCATKLDEVTLVPSKKNPDNDKKGQMIGLRQKADWKKNKYNM
jgi:hypothetical protein